VRVSLVSRFAEDRSRHGFWLTVYAWALRLARRVFGFTRIECLRLLRLKPETNSQTIQTVQCRFVTRRELECASLEPETELPLDFLTAALDKGDDCFGVFAGEKLISYAWYSAQPTDVMDGFRVGFPKDSILLYKAFTQPRYRGRGFNRLGVRQAAGNYLRLGFRAILCHVHAENLASLKSFDHLGCEKFGSVTYFRGARRIHHSAGCRAGDFAFTTAPSVDLQRSREHAMRQSA
jgi:hypothetical protein